MDTQIEQRRRALTTEDVSALVDAIEARAMDRIQKSLGRMVLNLAVKWTLRTIVIITIYSAGAAGILRRIFPS